MAECCFRVEDMNGKVIHLGDTVEFDVKKAREKHPEDYGVCCGARLIFKVAGFGYFNKLKCPYVYTFDWIPHFVDCCEVIDSQEHCSFSMEY